MRHSMGGGGGGGGGGSVTTGRIKKQLILKAKIEPLQSLPDPNNNDEENCVNKNINDMNDDLSDCKKSEKYSLRVRQQRSSVINNIIIKNEKQAKTTIKEKPKTKAAPLSKYRRKTANARERTRMREINTAFENLRSCVPVTIGGVSSGAVPAPNDATFNIAITSILSSSNSSSASSISSSASSTSSPPTSPLSTLNQQQQNANNEKLTKITTLRLAMNYIKVLNDLLTNKHVTQSDTNIIINNMNNNLNNNNNNNINLVNHNHNSLILNDNNNNDKLLKIPKPKQQTVEKKVSPASKHRKTKSKSAAIVAPATPAPSPIKSSANKVTKATAPASAQKMLKRNLKNDKFLQKLDLSPCLMPADCDDTDLGLMLMESDGESLHLSEPCLSPFEQHLKSQFAQQSAAAITSADSLELGLLLESDGESLHLSEPCLSPLSHLDSLNPFADLLHVGFNEQTALDMFLS